MNKLFSLLLFVLSIFILSCTRDVSVTDYRFTPKISIINGELFENVSTGVKETYVNAPIALSISIDGDEAQALEHFIKYNFIQGNGTFLDANNKTISPNTIVRHTFKNDDFNFVFTPTDFGICEFSVEISNEEISNSLFFKIFIREPSYIVSFSDIPDNLYIDKKFSFNLEIDELKESDIKTVTAYGKVTKGKGELYIADQIIAENDKPNIIKLGKTIISYSAKELDENILTFEIQDKYGTLQKFPVSFLITKPVYKVLLEKDEGEPVISNDYSFKVNIDKNDHPTNKFKISYRFIQGNGAIKLNGKSTESGSKVDALPGDNIFILNTPTAGLVDLEIIVTDGWDTQKAVKLECTVQQNPFIVEVKQNDTELQVGNSTTFSATLSEDNYKGKFYCTYRVTKGQGTINAGGSDRIEGTRFEMASGNNSFKFTPEKAGENEIELIFAEDNGQEVIKILKFTAAQPNLEISVVPISEYSTINVPYHFCINIDSESKINTFNTIFSLNSGSGTLKHGTKDIPSGGMVVLTKGQNNFNFIPTTTTTTQLSFAVSDSHNQTKTGKLDISATLPSFEASVTNVTSNVIVGNSASMTLNINTIDSNPTKVAISIEQGTGNFTLNGKAVTAGVLTSADIGTNTITFTPSRPGLNIIKLNVRDSQGRERNLTATVSASANPIIANINQTTTITKVGKDYSFTVDLSESGYTGMFGVSYRWLDGAGALLHNGQPIVVGTVKNTPAGLQTFVTTPGEVGNYELELTFSDIYEQSVTKRIAFAVHANDLEVISNNNAKEIMIGDYATFSASLSEASYSGKFYCAYRYISGKGELISNGRNNNEGIRFEINKGTNNFRFTPAKAVDTEIELTFSDEYNQEIKKNINYKVNSAEIVATISAPSDIVVGSTASVTLSASEASYESNFTVTYIPISGTGELKNGNTTVKPNDNVNVTNNVPVTFHYTPTITGEHQLRYAVRDTYNKIKTVDATINVKQAALKVTASSPSPVTVGNPATFNLTLDELHYNDNFSVKYDIVSGKGILKRNNIDVANGTIIQCGKGQHTFTFTPTAIGISKVRFTVTDKYNQSEIVDINFSGNAAPIQVAATTPGIVKIGSNSLFTLTVNSPYNEKNLSVNYQLLSGSGTLKKGPVIYSSGTNINIANGTHDFIFIPSGAGDNILKIFVKDEHNQSKEVTVNCKSEAYELNVSSSSINNITCHEDKIFTLTLSELQHPGNFTVKFRMNSGRGDFKYNGKTLASNEAVSVSSGSKNFVFTPRSINTSKIDVEVTDQYKQTKIHQIDVTNISPLTVLLTTTFKLVKGTEYTVKDTHYTYYAPISLELAMHSDKELPFDQTIVWKTTTHTTLYPQDAVSMNGQFGQKKETKNSDVSIMIKKGNKHSDRVHIDSKPSTAAIGGVPNYPGEKVWKGGYFFPIFRGPDDYRDAGYEPETNGARGVEDTYMESTATTSSDKSPDGTIKYEIIKNSRTKMPRGYYDKFGEFPLDWPPKGGGGRP